MAIQYNSDTGAPLMTAANDLMNKCCCGGCVDPEIVWYYTGLGLTSPQPMLVPYGTLATIPAVVTYRFADDLVLTLDGTPLTSSQYYFWDDRTSTLNQWLLYDSWPLEFGYSAAWRTVALRSVVGFLCGTDHTVSVTASNDCGATTVSTGDFQWSLICYGVPPPPPPENECNGCMPRLKPTYTVTFSGLTGSKLTPLNSVGVSVANSGTGVGDCTWAADVSAIINEAGATWGINLKWTGTVWLVNLARTPAGCTLIMSKLVDAGACTPGGSYTRLQGGGALCGGTQSGVTVAVT